LVSHAGLQKVRVSKIPVVKAAIVVLFDVGVGVGLDFQACCGQAFMAGMHCSRCSMLLGLHRTAVLRHDDVGQETLLNLLLRNYLHYNLYDQV
jgi:hypothetical protein